MKFRKAQQNLIDILPTLTTWSIVEMTIDMGRNFYDSEKDYRDDIIFDMYKEELSKRLLEAKVIDEPLHKEDR